MLNTQQQELLSSTCCHSLANPYSSTNKNTKLRVKNKYSWSIKKKSPHRSSRKQKAWHLVFFVIYSNVNRNSCSLSDPVSLIYAGFTQGEQAPVFSYLITSSEAEVSS